jgi:hypothetical protein
MNCHECNSIKEARGRNNEMATIVVKNETCSTRTERGENKEITKNDELEKI